MKGKATRQEQRGRPSRSTLYLSDPTADPTADPTVESLERRGDLEGAGPVLTGGDVDAVGEALGVPQAPDAEARTSEEILRDRDRHHWDLERKAGGDGHST